MKTIVVGYDASEPAERALRRAAEIAEAFSAQLVVVSVSGFGHAPTLRPTAELGPAAVAGPLAPAGAVPLPDTTPEPEELARQQLDRARRSLASRKGESEYVIELGDPAERLLEVADQRDADLIVVGSREHGFLERLLSGSVDEAVARRSERDVLLVH